MTSIGSSPYILQRYIGPSRVSSGNSPAEGAAETSAQTSATQPNKLAKLQADLEALKGRQTHMSITQYMTESFTLQEQIATERLNAGEDLETIKIRFGDRTYSLAGKRLDLSAIKVIGVPGIQITRAAQPENFESTAALSNYLARR